MKVKELIAALQQMPQTAQIMLWNGLVEDFVPIDKNINTIKFVKESLKHTYKSLLYEKVASKRLFSIPIKERAKVLKQAKELYKKVPYSAPNRFIEESEYINWYDKKQKTVIVLQPKVVGKTYSDRLGSISY